MQGKWMTSEMGTGVDVDDCRVVDYLLSEQATATQIGYPRCAPTRTGMERTQSGWVTRGGVLVV